MEIDSHKVGCPEYAPKTMLKLLVYGYSYGIRSSHKLEREYEQPASQAVYKLRQQSRTGPDSCLN